MELQAEQVKLRCTGRDCDQNSHFITSSTDHFVSLPLFGRSGITITVLLSQVRCNTGVSVDCRLYSVDCRGQRYPSVLLGNCVNHFSPQISPINLPYEVPNMILWSEGLQEFEVHQLEMKLMTQYHKFRFRVRTRGSPKKAAMFDISDEEFLCGIRDSDIIRWEFQSWDTLPPRRVTLATEYRVSFRRRTACISKCPSAEKPVSLSTPSTKPPVSLIIFIPQILTVIAFKKWGQIGDINFKQVWWEWVVMFSSFSNKKFVA